MQPLVRRADTTPRTLDARVIIVISLCLICLTRTLTDPGTLVGLESFLVLGAFFAGVNLFWLFTRSLVVLPFTLAALPVVFTLPGTTLFSLVGMTASREGLARWLLVVVHCWICYQVLLTAVSIVGPLGFIDGLSGLGVPRKIVDILRLTLRYLDLLIDEANRLRRARTLRAGADTRSLVQRTRTTGAMVGTLFIRSLDRASRIQLARTCRGGPVNRHVDRLGAAAWVQIVTVITTTTLLIFYQTSS